MKTKQLKWMLFLIVVFCSKLSIAQNIQLLMSPKPSPYLADWQTRTETVKLIITNPSPDPIEVKIKTELFDGSKNLLATTLSEKMQILSISSGTAIYSAEEVFPISAIEYKGSAATKIMRTGRIPEDNYQLCVALTDPKTGKTIGTSSTVCSYFSIVAYQAPILISPSNKISIPELETKGILFRWTPIIPKPQEPVIYKLLIWEVLEGQNDMLAIRINKPIVEKLEDKMTQTQWPIDFAAPEPGKNYVWSVMPLDEKENQLIEGLGIAEPFSFSIAANSTISCTCSQWTKLGWNLLNSSNNIINSYTVISGSTISIPAGNTFSLPNIVAPCSNSGCTQTLNYYLYAPNGTLVYQRTSFDPNLFREQLCNTSGTYKLVIKANCGNTSVCDDFVIYIEKKCDPNNQCICGNWNKVKIDTTYYGCKSVITKQCNKLVTFSNSFNCSSNTCNANINWSITGPGGFVSSGTGTGSISGNFIPTANGTYTIKMFATCNGIKCDSCLTFIRIIDCSNCNCGKWGKLYVNSIFKLCGPNTIVDQNCGTVVNFTNTFSCSPVSTACASVINWKVNGPSGFAASGSGPGAAFTGNFTPTANGMYTVKLYGICGIKICDSCLFKIRVTNCRVCNNCDSIIMKNPVFTNGHKLYALSGSITSTPFNPITKVVVFLEAISTNNPGTTTVFPNPNFEFLSTSTLGGSVVLPFSLSGSRSNVLMSSFATPVATLSYNLQIDNPMGHTKVSGNIKFLIFKKDGTFCEQYFSI